MTPPPAPQIEPVALQSRERLRLGREKIRRNHDAGVSGPQICTQITDLYDRVILDIWNQVVADQTIGDIAARVALVAHGGYGRCDVAPYSDVDLMLVPHHRANKQIQPLAAALSVAIVDAGLHLGFSVRSPREACQLAWKDPVIFSSLTESRLLAGSLNVYESYFESLRRGARRRRNRLIETVHEARREERVKWGETNYLLRPNVKRSRGGLRDVQLIRWIGFACEGETELDRLVELGCLPPGDYRLVRRGLQFLLRLRNELHFGHGRSQDLLDRGTQMKIADKWGYQPESGRLAVELFMQDYFEHTRNIRYASAHVYADVQQSSIVQRAYEWVRAKPIDDDIRVGPYHVWVVDARLPQVAGNLSEVLRLMDLSNRHSKRISHRTWQAIRSAMAHRQPTEPESAAVRYFLSLLSRPGRLVELLRQLHELRVLEQFIPAMKRARGLLQFNEYHKYTVDRHCLGAVGAATDFETSDGWPRELYSRLDDKLMLHLSLLIHDLGKGFEEDHSKVGERIAAETAARLGLDEAASKTLQWLILNHLIMHYAAFRHDLNDPQIIAKFASDVGTVQRLELLTLMSLADLSAVGPDVLTDWKEDLIHELYNRTKAYLETGSLPGEPSPQARQQQQQIAALLEKQNSPPLAHQLLAQLPEPAVLRPAVEFTAQLLHDVALPVHQGQAAPILCRGRFDASRGAIEYTVVMQPKSQPIGVFATATAALAACGLSILKSEIATLEDDWIWDTFLVENPQHAANQDEAIRQTGSRIQQLIASGITGSPQPSFWASRFQAEASRLELQPAEVRFDNETMDHYTILLLFAYDRPGLLAAISAVLASLKIVLHFAKIDTHLDQAVDVFYITELNGQKLLNEDRQQLVRRALLDAVERGRD